MLLTLAGIVVLGFASWWSFRVALADLLETHGSLTDARRAVLLTPASAAAHYNAATLYAALDPLTNRDDAELKATVSLNPRDSAAWMAWGLKSETEGDNAHAEQYLLEAARVDHMFKPAWSLANFYARTGQTEKFWPWIRKCVELLEHRNGEQWTYDPNPVFALCWNVSTDDAEIERRAIPPKAFILDRYLSYLVAFDHLDAARHTAARLYPLAGSQDLPFLYALCDALLWRSRGADAVVVWNSLIAARLLPYQPLDAPRGKSLTNADFGSEPTGHGFDWQFPRPADVYERYSGSSRTVRFDINGEEPENCELAGEAAPLLPGRRYRFKFRYRTTGMSGKPGLHWNVSNSVTHKDSAVLPPFSARDEDGNEAFDFETPQDLTLGRFALRYDRQPGTTRPRGQLTLGAMSLELLP